MFKGVASAAPFCHLIMDEFAILNDLPSQIIIITDGYDMFPPKKGAMGIHVLWLINNNDESVKPPFGKVARITV